MTRQRRTIFIVAALVALIDQTSKVIAVAMWSGERSSFGAIDLTLVRNSGGPFGVATDATLLWTAAGAAIVSLAVAAIARGRLDTHRLGMWATLAVGAMLGGGIGNLVDRIVRAPGIARGAVIDWIAIGAYPLVFNLADVALRAGSLILIGVLISDAVSNRGPVRSQTAPFDDVPICSGTRETLAQWGSGTLK